MLKFLLIIVSLLCSQLLVAQNVRRRPIPVDWYQKDPAMDSLAGITLDKAYGLLNGRTSHTVIVAVIDDGVDIRHEDLRAIIWTNLKEIPGNGIDDDQNGFTDDIHGWNFRGMTDGTIVRNEQAGCLQLYEKWRARYDAADTAAFDSAEKANWTIFEKAKKEYFDGRSSQDSTDRLFVYNIDYASSSLIAGDPDNDSARHYGSPLSILSPDLSHGTHVAGIIAAVRNNGIGIRGIADNVRIMPVVAGTAAGDERDKDVAAAIHYAVDNGAKVINMSFSKLFSPDKKVVDEAVLYAEKHDVLIVHAAGNDGVDIDSATNYHYPIGIYDDGRR